MEPVHHLIIIIEEKYFVSIQASRRVIRYTSRSFGMWYVLILIILVHHSVGILNYPLPLSKHLRRKIYCTHYTVIVEIVTAPIL